MKMIKPHLTNKQIDMLENIDGFIEWIEISGTCTTEDVEYLQGLINEFAVSISKSEVIDEVDKTCPWAEEN